MRAPTGRYRRFAAPVDSEPGSPDPQRLQQRFLAHTAEHEASGLPTVCFHSSRSRSSKRACRRCHKEQVRGDARGDGPKPRGLPESLPVTILHGMRGSTRGGRREFSSSIRGIDLHGALLWIPARTTSRWADIGQHLKQSSIPCPPSTQTFLRLRNHAKPDFLLGLLALSGAAHATGRLPPLDWKWLPSCAWAER